MQNDMNIFRKTNFLIKYSGNILNSSLHAEQFAASSSCVFYHKQHHRFPPSCNMPGKFKYNNLAEVITDGNAKFSKYQSLNSGITICIAQVNGPLVGGYFTFATEAFDDDGLPHTLEHLVFMGSEKYPYKGVLDLISNRCLSQGTNAWTATDHTCYTVTVAGEEGFLKFLPIYLDHLLFPTLRDAAYSTEVHHINGEGEDGGVVYCEMQGTENSGESLCYLGMLRALYPGHCGYKQETGGMLKNLRESTSNEKVKAYHKEFYRPENLCLTIVGQVEAGKVFESLIPVEERIMQEGKRSKFSRPWQSPVPPLLESVTETIEYPTGEEEYGMLLTAWRGPLVNDFFQVMAIQILMDYLTDTSVAPLNRDLIEIEDPLCNDVDYTVLEFSVTSVYLHFSSVPVKRLNELKEKLFALLKNIADGKEEINMQRMTTLIKKKKLYILSVMEDDPHDAVAGSVIGDFLYGSSVEDLENRLKEIPLIDKLFEKDAQFWVDVLKNYIVDRKHVIIKGIPSNKLSEKMTVTEKARIKEQREKLGPNGLQLKAETLNNAVALKEVPPPAEVLTSVSIPSVKSIKFHPIKRTCNVRASEGDDVQYSVNKMPCRFQVDVIQTNFVRLFVLIDTSHLPMESRMYLPLLIELLDECAITRDGNFVPYQDVVKELAEDTISVSASLGFGYSRFMCTSYSQVMLLKLMVEEDKYEKSVQWINEILYKICFEPSRIKSTANKMITDIPTIKQSGSSLVKSMMKNLIFKPDSNQWTASLFRQHKFLTKILKQLETNSGDIIQKLNEIKDAIAEPDKMVVHMSLNLNQLKQKVEPEDAWIQKFLPSTLLPSVMSSSFKKCSEYLQTFTDSGTRGLIAGLGSIETSFLLQTTKCSLSRDHPDYAPLLILNHYLIMSEGPMWRIIRGSGLAYGYGIWNNCDTGLISFSLFRSCDLVKAYEESIKIVDSHLNGITKWDMTLLESAVSSVMSELIEQIKTVSDVVSQSVRSYCQDSCVDFTKELQDLLEKVSKVTTSDMERVGIQYLQPLFNPELYKCTVTCNPAKVKEITEGLKKFNCDLTVVPSLDDSFMSKY